jgi:hypothetical protein
MRFETAQAGFARSIRHRDIGAGIGEAAVGAERRGIGID